MPVSYAAIATNKKDPKWVLYSKSIPSADETTPLRVGMEIISQATRKIGRIVSVSEKLSEVLVEFVDKIIPYQLSSFWDEVELAF